jgi:hypothetical protein
MAYDLVFRRRIDRDYSRDSSETPSRSSSIIAGLCFLAAGATLLAPEIVRQVENRRERERLRDDVLERTQELKAMPDMEEMMSEEGLGRVA